MSGDRLFNSKNLENPYGALAELRNESPLYWHEPSQAWIVLTHKEAELAFRDPKFSAARVSGFFERLDQSKSEAWQILQGGMSEWLTMKEGSEHLKLRNLFGQFFAQKEISSFKTKLSEIAKELISELRNQTQAELIGDLAYAFPVSVISEILGVPREFSPRLRECSRKLRSIFTLRAHRSIELASQAQLAFLEIIELFSSVIFERQKFPRNDLISRAIPLYLQDSSLRLETFVPNLIMLLFAGHETTTNLIGNGILNLLRHPEARELLQKDSQLLHSAIEEVLRYESPAQLIARRVEADLDFGGQKILEGSQVVIHIGAANRDPKIFDDPEEFKIGRSPNPHLAFGSGRHFCIGSNLARLEAQIILAMIFEEFPGLELARKKPAAWLPEATIRGLNELWVDLKA